MENSRRFKESLSFVIPFVIPVFSKDLKICRTFKHESCWYCCKFSARYCRAIRVRKHNVTLMVCEISAYDRHVCVRVSVGAGHAVRRLWHMKCNKCPVQHHCHASVATTKAQSPLTAICRGFVSRPYSVVRSRLWYCPSVVCLSVTFCIVAKRYVVEGRRWYRWIGRW